MSNFKETYNLNKFKVNMKNVTQVFPLELRTDFPLDIRYDFETTFYKGNLRLVKYPNTSNIKYDNNEQLTIYITKNHKFYNFLFKLLNAERNMNKYKIVTFLNWLHKKINVMIVKTKADYNVVKKLYGEII